MTSNATMPHRSPAALLPERLCPTLTPAQLARVASHGVARSVQRGDVLVEPGVPTIRFFILTTGEAKVLKMAGDGELVGVLRPGQFTGEVNVLSGRPALGRVQVSEAGAVLEIDREALIACLQRDSDSPRIVIRELHTACWPLARMPLPLETSLPGVFAIGDVRSGSMKRVASVVGEGSTAVALVHQVLKH